MGEPAKLEIKDSVNLTSRPARKIARLKLRDSINFNMTENGTLDCARDKCVIGTHPDGHGLEVFASGENRVKGQGILIPWSNITYIKYE